MLTSPTTAIDYHKFLTDEQSTQNIVTLTRLTTLVLEHFATEHLVKTFEEKTTDKENVLTKSVV